MHSTTANSFADPSVRKRYFTGTHRVVSPEDTLKHVQRFTAVMGITRIANVTGLDSVGIPVVMVSRPNARSISVSQGKGANLIAAKVSGVMESIETFHAENICAPLRLGSWEDLRYTHRLADVHRLPRASREPFDEFKRLLWIESKNLLDQSSVWLPYELVHLDYTPPLPTGHGSFASTSNGLASGNHLTEAIIHGLCEVIERDATTLWQLQPDKHANTRIDLVTVNDPACRSLIERFQHAGAGVGIWDTTSDIGVPSFLCRVVQNGGQHRFTIRPASGMGCHPQRSVALSRALTEAAQSRLTFIAGSRDDLDYAEYEQQLNPENQARWVRAVVGDGAGRAYCQVPSFESDSLDHDLAWILDRLKHMGVTEVLMVELTRSEFAIPVVRMVVPGLEGILSDGRRAMGSRAQATLGLQGNRVSA